MSDDRHQRAVAQTLSWAQRAADGGDLREALGWVDTVMTIDDELPAGWEARREHWQGALADRETARRAF